MTASSNLSTLYTFSAIRNNGEPLPLSTFDNRVLLIVNTASRCGFTPQYQGLESLYQTYKDKGFSVLAFPCNQFGHQEPGSDAEIAKFCALNHGITFPLFQKIDVNGPNAHPLFTFLKDRIPGTLGSKGIKWNFTKFLIDRHGVPVARFAPTTPPNKLAAQIETLLTPVS